MNFTSSFFLFGFPAILIFYHRFSPACRRSLLLAASWMFYAFGSSESFWLLIFVTLVTYLCAVSMERAVTKRTRHFFLWLAVCVVLFILFLFKYLGFLEQNFDTLLGIGKEIHRLPLPAGISFYTFQSLAYCVDVYQKRISAEKNFFRYALFVSFFPQLVAGPIEQAAGLMPQLACEKTASAEDLRTGSFLILRGYFKKIAIADFLAPRVDEIFSATQFSGFLTLSGAVLFAFQIYSDFSGYSDIALGTARLFGIHLTKNFDSPYLAVNIQDFWRRWHITLTRFFTEYVYIPLGGSRAGMIMQLRNILVLFLLSGLWHGADWHFIAWGAFHGICLSIYILVKKKKTACLQNGKLVKFMQTVGTFLLTSMGWILFRALSMKSALTMFAALPFGWSLMPNALVSFTSQHPSVALRILSIPVLLYFLRDMPKGWLRSNDTFYLGYLMLLIILLSWGAALSAGASNAFLYFQF